jgi:hypothetical protein
MGRRKEHSLGEMISSLTFFGCAVYLVISAIEWQDQGDHLRAMLSWLAALLCFLGSIRFQVAQWVMALTSFWRKINDKN